MRNIIAIISGLISIGATLPYILDIIHGKTRPNIVTWFTWASLSCITAVAALTNHATQTAIFAGALALTNYAIVIFGLRKGIRRYTKFDAICQSMAIIGIILWRITNNPNIAVLFVIISDLIGALPTYRHIWLKPYEETLQTFVVYFISDLFILASLASFSFVSLAYPAYITLSTISIVMLITVRRHAHTASN